MNLCLAFAELWAHKLTRANSFNNGDDSAAGGLTSMFAMMAADPCPQRYDEIKDGIIDWFIEMHASNPKREYYISVDYHPDSYIGDICKTLRINPNNAPWKSYCRIQFAGDLVTPVLLVWAFGYRTRPTLMKRFDWDPNMDVSSIPNLKQMYDDCINTLRNDGILNMNWHMLDAIEDELYKRNKK